MALAALAAAAAGAAGTGGRRAAPRLGCAAWQTLQQRRPWSSSGAPAPEQQPPAAPAPGDGSARAGAGAGAGAAPPQGDGFELVYSGFFAAPHRRLKFASLLNTFASLAAAPLILSYSSASPIARVAVVTSVLGFAIITTGGLHWFTKPYVHALSRRAADGRLRATGLTFFGRRVSTEFDAAELAQPDGYHPLASFKARGRTYYVDRGSFADKALLARLMPWEAPAPEGDSGGGAGAQQGQQQQGQQQPGQQQQ
ncbi:hypothetical protein HT031_002415 [Scenedesmus sp. PABB004]|nr:hypothetical protein HT031_002415 [Scenedesmus sp. PABB004]